MTRTLGSTVFVLALLLNGVALAGSANLDQQFLLEGSGDYQPIGTDSTLSELAGSLPPVVVAKMLSKIDAALLRIDDGTYGYCEETGEPIGLKRLDARPVATLVVP